MKTICLDCRYITPYMDGIGRYLFNLADKLSLYNDSENLYNLLIIEQKQFAERSILRTLENRKNLGFIQLPIYPQTIANHLLALFINKYKIDLFHYGQFDFPLSINTSSIATIHDLNPQIFPNFFTSRQFIKKNYAVLSNFIALKKASYIIAVSNSTKAELLRLYGNKYEDSIKVVYEGIDDDYFKSAIDGSVYTEFQEIRNKYGIEKYILYVGNNRPHKNITRMIEAYKILKGSGRISHKFIIIGKSNPAFPSFEEIIYVNNLEEDVITLHCNDTLLKAFYKYADAFVYCSLSEGFGLPILEAMSAGIPVVTSNVSSMKELAVEAAVQVNPYDVLSIAEGVESVVNNPEKQNILKRLGLKRAQEFSWEKCAKETIDIYKLALQ